MAEKVIAMKFGGTSVATAERRQMIVGHVKREFNDGFKVALVISAMGRRGDPYATDTLLDLLRNQGGEVDPRTYSFIFVTGEMISVAVMVHTLRLAGIQAEALTGGMAGIITEDFFMSAKVVSLENKKLKEDVRRGIIPVVCGGQGITNTDKDFSILGRGGSDTSGVLVGIMTGAERADIYTDVEYMMATDPRIIPDAPQRKVISFESAYEMARFGAKVVHPGSVKLGMENKLPIRVRSTFSQNPGTLICAEKDNSALVGIPVVNSAQIAMVENQSLTAEQLATLEQHVGLLSLVDENSRKLILCAPAGDTVSLVDHELSKMNVKQVTWQTGVSLLSLVGVAEKIPEMVEIVKQVCIKNLISISHYGLSGNRVTFVLSENQSKSALTETYSALKRYL